MNVNESAIFNAPVCLVEASSTWEIVYSNKMARSHGFEEGESILEVLKDRYFSKGRYEDLIRSGEPFNLQFQSDNKQSFQAEVNFIEGTDSWSFSFTKANLLEETSQTKYNKFVKSAVDKLPIDIVIYDKDLHFAYINEVAVKDAKLRKWLIGKSIEDYVAYRGLPNEHAVSRRSFFNNIIDEQEPVNWIDEYYFKDGKNKFMLRNYYPYIVGDEVEFLYGCGVDITKEKETEYNYELLIKDLTVRNKLLSQFSYVTSHNLRSHSANLLGLSGLIDTVRTDPEQLDDILGKIKFVTKNLDATLFDLNTILNLEKDSDKKEEVDLQEMLDDIFSVFMAESDRVAAQMSTDLEVKRVEVSKTNLNSVLHNLMSNAIKYSAKHKFCKILIRSYLDGKDVKISVEDNGIGIDTIRHKNKLFQLYKRFSPEHATGRGIGLFLVKSQVHSMKGRIDVKSQVGRGTTFTITLPQESYVREKNLTITKRI